MIQTIIHFALVASLLICAGIIYFQYRIMAMQADAISTLNKQINILKSYTASFHSYEAKSSDRPAANPLNRY